jgi:phosphatidate cytidylyltransferase
MILDTIRALSPVWQMGVVILCVLVVSTIVIAALRFLQPQKNYAELLHRTISWWVMASVFFGAVAVNDRIGLVLFAFLSFWAMKEYVTLLKTRPADHGVLPVRLMLSRETAGFVASASQIQWGLMAFVFGLSHLGFLLIMPSPVGSDANGRTMLLFLVFVAEISDVLQYVWGKTLGRHKILPSVSPNKTWEGFLGGIASTVVLSLGLRFLTPFSVGETILVSLMITVAGFGGGAVMSAVKRDFGVKDFGGLIPGHGGMLDRVDSLCYAAPIFFHYVRYFHFR